MILPGDFLFEEAEALTTEALTSDAVFPEPQGVIAIAKQYAH